MSTEVEVVCPLCQVRLAVASYADGVPVGPEWAYCCRCHCTVEVREHVTVVIPGLPGSVMVSVTAVAGGTVRVEVGG